MVFSTSTPNKEQLISNLSDLAREQEDSFLAQRLYDKIIVLVRAKQGDGTGRMAMIVNVGLGPDVWLGHSEPVENWHDNFQYYTGSITLTSK